MFSLQKMIDLVRRAETYRCCACDDLLPEGAINQTEQVAFCSRCYELQPLSEAIRSTRSVEEILAERPSGCSLVQNGDRIVIRASERSIGDFLGAGIFGIFWNGGLSIFLAIALAGLYSNLIGPVPRWDGFKFWNDLIDPATGKPIMNDAPMDLGMTLFICLFLTPFVLIGLGAISFAMMSLWGRTEIMLDDTECYAARGLGPFLWKKRFDRSAVRKVRVHFQAGNGDSSPTETLVIEADRSIECGSALSERRREWLRAVLKGILFPRNDAACNGAI